MFDPERDPGRPVLGIDPGVSRCGYGAIAGRGPDVRVLTCGVIRTDPGEPLPVRLGRLADELDALLDDVAPVVLAVERVLFQANVRTAMSVGQASGLALAGAARRNIPVAQYSPNEVKLAITGHGGADKVQVQAMVARLLRLPELPRPPDVADALALALCHRSGATVRDARARAT
ncbi:MAG: crossover junction endodeoxyribonuclease RuvC, partial [Actinobacteria bacterium]|nr:crossover junction endodeoxyribonuclease RuvC [Actinomycetota bacterium]